MTTEEKLVTLLKKQNRHIAFAESCTAGLAVGALVDVPSASAVLDASFVTYANEAKMKYLQVSPDTLEKYGAVSEQVAGEMAKGAAISAGAEVGVGISGIAGPEGGTEEKPVGTVCFGFYIDGRVSACRCAFGNLGRRSVRESAVKFALKSVLMLLEKEEKNQ